MSAPENPFGSDPPAAEDRPQVSPPEIAAPSQPRFPVWGAGDLMRVLLVLLMAIFFADLLATLITGALPAFRHTNARALATDARVVVPAQAAAYLVTVWFIVRMISHHYRCRFFAAIHWRFPSGWLKYVAGGMVLAIVIQGVSSRLPIPKQMPIDQFFRSTLGAWMMAVFGTVVAPFCEELFFRGLLFPVLLRRLGMFMAVLVTAVLFALIHASQLAQAWAPVVMLFVVGVVLTLVRARGHSLAASVLVHSGYNLALFSLLYASTSGFHNFNQLSP